MRVKKSNHCREFQSAMCLESLNILFDISITYKQKKKKKIWRGGGAKKCANVISLIPLYIQSLNKIQGPGYRSTAVAQNFNQIFNAEDYRCQQKPSCLLARFARQS